MSAYNGDSLRSQLTPLVAQALSALTQGFSLFYPTPHHHISLLRELMSGAKFGESPDSSDLTFEPSLRLVLAENLCEDDYIEGLVEFAWNNNDAENDIVGEAAMKTVTGTSFAASHPQAVQWSPKELNQIMSTLLVSCSAEAQERLQHFNLSTSVESTRPSFASSSTDLLLLLHLQKHVLKRSSRPTEASASPSSPTPSELILSHALELFTSARALVDSINYIVSSSQMSSQLASSAGEILSTTFLSLLVPTFCDSIVSLRKNKVRREARSCVCGFTINVQLRLTSFLAYLLCSSQKLSYDSLEACVNLIPSTVHLIRSIDALNNLAKVRSLDPGSFDAAWGWSVELQCSIVKLSATLACEMVAGEERPGAKRQAEKALLRDSRTEPS